MMDFLDFLEPEDDLTPRRPVCPTCHLEVPVAGVCEEC